MLPWRWGWGGLVEMREWPVSWGPQTPQMLHSQSPSAEPANDNNNDAAYA